MEQHEQRHPRSTEPAIHGHFFPRRDGERNRLGVAVEKVYVTRSAGECARRANAVADVLHTMRRVTRDHPARRFVVKAKCRNAAVLAVKHSGLAVRRRRWQATEPSSETETFAQQPRDRRAQTELERPPQIGIRERVDLQHDEAALRRTRTLLAREWTVLCAIVPPQERSGPWTGAAL